MLERPTQDCVEFIETSTTDTTEGIDIKSVGTCLFFLFSASIPKISGFFVPLLSNLVKF